MITVDHGLNELSEVRALAATSLLVEGSMLSEGTTFLWIDGYVVVARGQVLLRGEVVVDSVSHVDDLLRCVNFICVATGSRVNLQICPDDSLLVEKRCQDLLHELVLHVHQLAEDEDLVSILASVCKLSHLAFDFILQILPDLLHV